MTRSGSLGERMRQGGTLLGTFQKTAHHQVTEVLAHTKLDFAVLDAEHSSFGALQMDTCILAARAHDFPIFVRVSSNRPEALLAPLDMGAVGVFVPHTRSRADAENAASASQYLTGTRGFSPSTRAGAYGTRGLQSYREAADREIALVLQIEDREALAEIADIAATPSVSGLFVGRADLAASMHLDWDDPAIDRATEQVAQACRNSGIACGAYLADERRRREFSRWGVTFFVVGSDQGALRAHANQIAETFQNRDASAKEQQ